MKAPAYHNANASRLLANGPMGSSPAFRDVRGQQSLSMVGALGPTVPAQERSGAEERRRQLLQQVNTEQLGLTRAIGNRQAELATAPQGDALHKEQNLTAAAELMTPEQKAQALNARIREEIVAAGTELTNERRLAQEKPPIESKLAEIGRQLG